MNIPINFIIHLLIMATTLVMGVVFFSIHSLNREFILAMISILTAILFVNVYGTFTKTLTAKILGYIISISIMLIAVAVFGIYGFEQTAIGFQTLYNINLEGIAISLGLILFSSIMFVFSLNRDKTPIVIPKAVKINFKPLPAIKEKEIVIDSNEWEEATSKDLKSGYYIEV